MNRRTLAPVVGVAALLAVWELFVRVFRVASYKLPRPSAIVAELRDHWSVYVREAWPSIVVMLGGLAIALVLAGVVAALLAHSSFAERAVTPLAVFVQVTPLYAYVTVVLLWVGFGVRAVVTMIAIVSFPPFLMNLTAGFRDVDASALELLRSVDASRWEIFRRLRVPSALPQFFSALKVSSGLALVGVAIGEPGAFVEHGIGLMLRRAAAAGNDGVPQLWGCIFVLGLIGSFAYVAISGIERAALRWHSSSADLRR